MDYLQFNQKEEKNGRRERERERELARNLISVLILRLHVRSKVSIGVQLPIKAYCGPHLN